MGLGRMTRFRQRTIFLDHKVIAFSFSVYLSVLGQGPVSCGFITLT